MQVLSCVDWLGPLPMNPHLLQAVVAATEAHHLEQVIPKELHLHSYIAANVNAVQRAVSSRALAHATDKTTAREPVSKPTGFIAVRSTILLLAS